MSPDPRIPSSSVLFLNPHIDGSSSVQRFPSAVPHTAYPLQFTKRAVPFLHPPLQIYSNFSVNPETYETGISLRRY